MRVEDIINRMLLMGTDMSNSTVYQYSGDNLVKEIRTVYSDEAHTRGKVISITYAYTGDKITGKEVVITDYVAP